MTCKNCKEDLTRDELSLPKLAAMELCYGCYVESVSGSEVAED